MPKREGQATAQVPQHRWSKGCASADHRHTRQRGRDSAISLVGGGNMQPRPSRKGGQVSRGRYEYLGIRLGIRQGILESEQDLQGRLRLTRNQDLGKLRVLGSLPVLTASR